MNVFRAERLSTFEIPYIRDNKVDIYPFVRSDAGDETIFCVSPIHGRSFVLCHNANGRWTVGKGNGLSYTSHPFVLTTPVNGDTWGGLSLDSAIRDYNIGNQVRELGIKTNIMDCVIALDKPIIVNGLSSQSALLQYSVECPYRISDFGFIPKDELKHHIGKWQSEPNELHLYAARVFIQNLRILHDNHIMHNAMHPINYTWALELVDFEASRSDKYPYDNAAYEAHVPMLIELEVIQVYEIINYVAWCLGEQVNYNKVEKLFEQYGFVLNPIR